MTAFKGEQAITSALIDVVEGKKNVVGYLLGHKEAALSGESPISTLKTFIENENVQFKELNLFEVPVSQRCKSVDDRRPAIRPLRSRDEIAARFLEQRRRVLLLVDPAAKIPKLLAFVNELGVKVDDDRLMAVVKTASRKSRASGTWSRISSATIRW